MHTLSNTVCVIHTHYYFVSDAALELLFSNKKLWSFIHSIIEGSAVTKELKASTVLIIANMARNG